MGKIISFFNQKGGVGKTTCAINMSAFLADMGKKILLIDLDPQANASSGLGVNKKNQANVYSLLKGESQLDESIENVRKNLDLLASTTSLAGLEIELISQANWHYLLRDKLEPIREDYDFIFIDCPPSLGVLSTLALTNSDSLIIPIQAEYYALEGVSQLYETVKMIQSKLNPQLRIEGVLLTMFDSRTNLANQVKEEVEKFFKDLAYDTSIPRNVRLAEAPSHGKDIFSYQANSAGAFAYKRLAREFLKRNGG